MGYQLGKGMEVTDEGKSRWIGGKRGNLWQFQNYFKGRGDWWGDKVWYAKVLKDGLSWGKSRGGGENVVGEFLLNEFSEI